MKGKEAPCISIILVNYESERYTEQCIRSILKSTQTVSYEIIVVDNHSGNHGLEYLRGQFPQITMIDSGRNGGFAYGNNAGVGMARGRYLLLFNNDTEMKDGMLDEMVRYAEAHPEIGILGCRAVDARGGMLPVSHPYENRKRLYLQTYVKPLLEKIGLQRKMVRRFERDAEVLADQWISGSAMLIRRALYDQIGGLDENYFMYMEDEDLCHRLRDAGYPAGILPMIGYVHHCGGSSAPSYFLTREYMKSRLIYFMRYHPRAFGKIRRLLYRQIPVYNKGLKEPEIRKMKEELDRFADTELKKCAGSIKTIHDHAVRDNIAADPVSPAAPKQDIPLSDPLFCDMLRGESRSGL